MTTRLPGRVIVALAVFTSASLLLGTYLEAQHLAWLQSHPYLANLFSGMTGFSASILVVAVGLNWLVRRSEFALSKPIRLAAVARFRHQLEIIRAGLPDDFRSSLVLSPLDGARTSSGSGIAPVVSRHKDTNKLMESWSELIGSRRFPALQKRIDRFIGIEVPHMITVFDLDRDADLRLAMSEIQEPLRELHSFTEPLPAMRTFNEVLTGLTRIEQCVVEHRIVKISLLEAVADGRLKRNPSTQVRDGIPVPRLRTRSSRFAGRYPSDTLI